MRDPEQHAEYLYRIVEFRKWIDSNVLFPAVPDSVVKPLRECLRATENVLVIALHAAGELERAAVIER